MFPSAPAPLSLRFCETSLKRLTNLSSPDRCVVYMLQPACLLSAAAPSLFPSLFQLFFSPAYSLRPLITLSPGLTAAQQRRRKPDAPATHALPPFPADACSMHACAPLSPSPHDALHVHVRRCFVIYLSCASALTLSLWRFPCDPTQMPALPGLVRS